MTLYAMLQVLYFFIPAYVGNLVPLLARHHLHCLSQPIDGGRTLWGKSLLGSHKTWRGVFSGVVMGTLVYEGQRLVDAYGIARELALLDYAAHPIFPGLLMGLGAGIAMR